jgi:hypothetical protein
MIVPSDVKTPASGSEVESSPPFGQAEASTAGPPPYISSSPSVAPPAEKPLPVSPTQGIFVAPRDELALRPRTNFLYSKEEHHSIKGSWTIDPNVRIPRSLLIEVPEGEERKNLYLRSEHGHTSAKLALISDEPTKSVIDVSSGQGHVSLKIVSRFPGDGPRRLIGIEVTSPQPTFQPQSDLGPRARQRRHSAGL